MKLISFTSCDHVAPDLSKSCSRQWAYYTALANVGIGTNVLDIQAYRIPFKANDGSEIILGDLVNVSPVVLFFYPKASSPICTKQACQFRDEYSRFVSKAKVFGISSDSAIGQDKFSRNQSLPFLLLSDKNNRLRNGFEVKNNWLVLPGRQTYVINKQGKIIMSFNSAGANGHVEKALEALEQC